MEEIKRRPRRPKAKQDIAVAQNENALLTIDTVCTLTGLAQSTIRKYIRESDFPKPIPMGHNKRLWPAKVVNAWLQKKAAPEGAAAG